MAFLDILNSDSDRKALISVIDTATLDLTSKIVPALQLAGDEMVDRALAGIKDVLAQANTDAVADYKQIAMGLQGEIADLRATLAAVLNRLDGAKLTLTLGTPKGA